MASKDGENVTNELGDKLRKARERAGLTQADVASAVDVHVNFYARLERGERKPSLESLQRIMKVLKIKMDISADDDSHTSSS